MKKKHRRSKQRKESTSNIINITEKNRLGVSTSSRQAENRTGATEWENSDFVYFNCYLGIYTLSPEAYGFIGVWFRLGLQSFHSVLSDQAQSAKDMLVIPVLRVTSEFDFLVGAYIRSKS